MREQMQSGDKVAREWTTADLNTLKEMTARGCRTGEMMEVLGRTMASVKAKVSVLKYHPQDFVAFKRKERAKGNPNYRPRPGWTEAETALLLSLRDDQRKSWDEIANIMGYSCAKVASKWGYEKFSSSRQGCKVAASALAIVPDHVHQERLRRQTLEPRDLTAAFCGDPLPGFSALERRS